MDLWSLSIEECNQPVELDQFALQLSVTLSDLFHWANVMGVRNGLVKCYCDDKFSI